MTVLFLHVLCSPVIALLLVGYLRNRYWDRQAELKNL